jgi:Tfp pilus assembly protein PilX
MDEATELVIAPFRDIVEKGKQAVENAGDNEVMLKAAQSLVREGERALKKIEPLCKKQAEEYRSNFVLALKENGELLSLPLSSEPYLYPYDRVPQRMAVCASLT